MKHYILLVALILVGCSDNPSSQSSTSVPVKINEHRVIATEDISYAGCKRVTYRIAVPDESTTAYSEETMQQIIDSNKSKWDDITVWAFKYSEEDNAKNMMNTMGMKEFSTCN